MGFHLDRLNDLRGTAARPARLDSSKGNYLSSNSTGCYVNARRILTISINSYGES